MIMIIANGYLVAADEARNCSRGDSSAKFLAVRSKDGGIKF